MDQHPATIPESPEYLRMSLAAAMTLGFKIGHLPQECQAPLH